MFLNHDANLKPFMWSSKIKVVKSYTRNLALVKDFFVSQIEPTQTPEQMKTKTKTAHHKLRVLFLYEYVRIYTFSKVRFTGLQ